MFKRLFATIALVCVLTTCAQAQSNLLFDSSPEADAQREALSLKRLEQADREMGPALRAPDYIGIAGPAVKVSHGFETSPTFTGVRVTDVLILVSAAEAGDGTGFSVVIRGQRHIAAAASRKEQGYMLIMLGKPIKR